MHSVEEVATYCPYCAAPITLLIDGSIPDQEYIEDCEVCCRPIVVRYKVVGKDEIQLDVAQEDA